MIKSLQSYTINVIYLLAFCISTEKALISPLIILALLFSLIIIFASKYKLIVGDNLPLLLLICLFVCYVIGIINTSNIDSGKFDLEQKLSFIIMPIIFFVNRYYIDLQKIMKYYILGCIASITLCSINAFLNYYNSYKINTLFYNNFSLYHHPSYEALFLCFGILYLLYYLLNNKEKFTLLRKIALIAVLIYFSIAILMLSSKTGIIALVLIVLVSLLYYMMKFKKYTISIFTMMVSLGALIFSIKYIPEIKNRFKELIYSSDKRLESSSVRKVIWIEAIDLIKLNPFGYGTGDVKDVLMNRYAEKNITVAFNKKLNCHNQFLQTTMAIGIVGLFLLLAVIAIPIFQLTGSSKYIYLGFALLMLFNFLTESILETQSGIVFFSFFYCCLANKNTELLSC